MVHTEQESSYIFDYESITCLLAQCHYKLIEPEDIVDYYLSKDTRIRTETVAERIEYFLQHKIGKKMSGTRVEESVSLSADAARLLIPQAKLVIKKRRYTIHVQSYLWIAITVDFVESPLKVAIVECEVSDSQIIPPLQQIFGYRFPLVTCPLSAWDYFRRRIGICGAPSAGKSEVARSFTATLNTTFGGNAFPVQEYATTFVQRYDCNPGFAKQFLIYEGQHTRELSAAKRSDIVISDCPTFLSYLYAMLHDKKRFNLIDGLVLSKLYKRVLLDLQHYTDIVFLRFQRYRENGVRFHDEATAKLIDSQIANFLQNHNVPHIESRCEDWEQVLQQLLCLNVVVEIEDEGNYETRV